LTETDIVWEEPPRNGADDRRMTFWRDVATKLREHPKRWARVQTYPTRAGAASKVTRINSGNMRGLGEGRWEAKHRGSDAEGWSLYLRFLGEEGSEAPTSAVPEETDE
jgi:hypothetical protein